MIEPQEALTDENGLALFRLKGLASYDWSPINIYFRCEEREATMHVD